MGKVYVYCRVANENQAEIEYQRKTINNYCENKGLKVSECFCDNGISGLQYDRSGLSKMLNVMQKDDIIVIKDIARLSRNFGQYMHFEERINNVGATLVAIDKPNSECSDDCLEMLYKNYIRIRRKNKQ